MKFVASTRRYCGLLASIHRFQKSAPNKYAAASLSQISKSYFTKYVPSLTKRKFITPICNWRPLASLIIRLGPDLIFTYFPVKWFRYIKLGHAPVSSNSIVRIILPCVVPILAVTPELFFDIIIIVVARGGDVIICRGLFKVTPLSSSKFHLSIFGVSDNLRAFMYKLSRDSGGIVCFLSWLIWGKLYIFHQYPLWVL